LAKDLEVPEKCLRKAMSKAKNKLTKQKRLINNNCTLMENLSNTI